MDMTDHLRLDLSRAPLLVPFIAADQDSPAWYMVLVCHHIVCDHVALERVSEEVLLLLQSSDADLPPAMQYRSLIAQLINTPQDAHESYFRAVLGDFTVPTALFDVLDVQGTGRDMREARLVISPSTAQRLRSAARCRGASSAALFHLAWAKVLAQCSGQSDVVFGTLLFGRLHGSSGADRAVGMFINTLPFRLDVGDIGVKQALETAFSILAGLLEHEHAPLALAQRCSGVPPQLPLFTTLLNFRHSQRTAQKDHRFPEGVSYLGGDERTNYPVTISIDDWGDSFSIKAQCTNGIDPIRVASYLETAINELAETLAREPGLPMSEIDILPKGEREQLLIAFNDTAVPYPRERLLHQLFEEQATRQPDGTAVVFEDQHLSYDEL
ncbi:condensation domain-containing protein, partial [Massilia aurea]